MNLERDRIIKKRKWNERRKEWQGLRQGKWISREVRMSKGKINGDKMENRRRKRYIKGQWQRKDR